MYLAVAEGEFTSKPTTYHGNHCRDHDSWYKEKYNTHNYGSIWSRQWHNIANNFGCEKDKVFQNIMFDAKASTNR